MHFGTWAKRQPYGALMQISRDFKIGYTTIHRAICGESIIRHDVAKRLSEATGGAVTADELHDPPRIGARVKRVVARRRRTKAA